MKKQELIEKLENGSFVEHTFMSTKQVIELIKQLDDENNFKFNKETFLQLFENLREDITRQVSRNFENFDTDDVVDLDSAEFNIGYNNRLELESVDVKLDSLEDNLRMDVETSLDEFLDNINSELEQEQEVLEIPTSSEDNEEENEEA